MNANSQRAFRFRQRFSVAFASLACAGVFALTNSAFAQAPVSIEKVEEDWELVVGTPDPNSSGPQITCSIAPVADDDSLYATFELNHRTQPAFERGGLQLQTWSSSFNLDSNPYPQNQIMSTTGETVTWTQSMRLSGETLTFEINNGNSTTWGNFGGQGYMRSSHVSGLSNLNNYSPADSVANSGVGFAGNRVQSLTLKRVRYYTTDGQVISDEQPHTVHVLD